MLAVLFTSVVISVAFAVIVGVMASARGRVGYGWFLLSLVLSPLITGPLVLVLPRRHTQPQTVTVGAILKWSGITILFACVVGCVAVVGMFVLCLFLIVQHGGA